MRRGWGLWLAGRSADGGLVSGDGMEGLGKQRDRSGFEIRDGMV